MSFSPEILELLRQTYAAGAVVEITADDKLGLKGRSCPEHLKDQLKANRDAVFAEPKAQRIGEQDGDFIFRSLADVIS